MGKILFGLLAKAFIHFVYKNTALLSYPSTGSGFALEGECGEYRNRTDDLLTASQTL
jgi:hypothetical protein